MDKETDIVIIGGGMASLAAAVELDRSGREITLVRKAPGATALSSGSWDLAADPIPGRGGDWQSLPLVTESIQNLIRGQKFHPYQVISQSLATERMIPFLKSRTEKIASVLPLEISGDPNRNMLLLTEFGTVRPSAMVQSSMREADLSHLRRAKVLVVGIQGFPNFNARFIRQCLDSLQEKQSKTYIEFTGHMEVRLPGDLDRPSLTAPDLATALDREEIFSEFGKQVIAYIRNKIYSHLFVPPVLGFKNTKDILAAIKKITGLKVAETLATPISIPGWRLSEAILQYFKKKEYDLIEGEVVGFDSERRRIQSIRIHQGDERIRLRAKSFILASGKFIGGGISRNGIFKESIFGLPVYLGDEVLTHRSPMRMQTFPAGQAQPYFCAGIGFNGRVQPLGPNREVLYDNLFAAGSVLQGFDPVHAHGTTGVSLLSGTLAAQGILGSF